MSAQTVYVVLVDPVGEGATVLAVGATLHTAKQLAEKDAGHVLNWTDYVDCSTARRDCSLAKAGAGLYEVHAEKVIL